MPKLNIGSRQIELDDYKDTGLRIALLASSGAGKGYATGVILEELHEQLIPIVAIDPESELWTFQEVGGIVAGGPHADAPLPWYWEWPEATGRRAPDPLLHFNADVTRQLIVHAMDSLGIVVFDLGGRQRIASWMLLKEGEAVMEVFEEVAEHRRQPVGFAAIEASIFAPQQVPGGGQPPEELYGMAQRGRKRGVISIVETQRPQDIQKRVTSQAIVRLIGRLDAVEEYRVLRPYLGARTAAEMRHLERGHFIWDDEDLVIRERRVTHGGGTPGGGPVEIRRRPANRDTDLPLNLRNALIAASVAPATPAASPTSHSASSSEGQKSEAPLRERIASLEREVETRGAVITQERATHEGLVRQLELANRRVTGALDELAQYKHDAELAQTFRTVLAGLFGEGMPAVVVGAAAALDEEKVVELIRLHAGGSGTTVQVAPVEKLRRDYLERAAQRLYDELEALETDEREVVLFLTAQARRLSGSAIALGITGSNSGSMQTRWNKAIARLRELGMIDSDSHGHQVDITAGIRKALVTHNPTDDEVAAVRDRALTLLHR